MTNKYFRITIREDEKGVLSVVDIEVKKERKWSVMGFLEKANLMLTYKGKLLDLLK